MEVVKLYSPIEDKNIRTNLNGSLIWKQAYTEEELPEANKIYPSVYEYQINFNGLKPVQVNKVTKVSKSL